MAFRNLVRGVAWAWRRHKKTWQILICVSAGWRYSRGGSQYHWVGGGSLGSHAGKVGSFPRFETFRNAYQKMHIKIDRNLSLIELQNRRLPTVYPAHFAAQSYWRGKHANNIGTPNYFCTIRVRRSR